ncbi:MAG: oleate hydratase [Synergistaceae bacterium]|nr:oleate hydratase [Synergistaceae bacterium]MBP9626171.1 oleate hydratase [Synergistaceae bacterium]MBP9957807.1 oleate hydratase [Synergistaceae bacterium]
MYHSNGNYEAFAKPLKPKDVDKKSAYLVGCGLASLSAACFLIRDGQMKGENIHILEEQNIPGGACDGIKDPQKGFIIRGGREMENHFECLWDLFRSIPSLETSDASVLDEFYWLNKRNPNFSLCRATVNRGEDAQTDGKFTLSEKASIEIAKLFITMDEDLYDKTIDDVFDDDVYASNFWLYWQTMFAFEKWHSALEMKRYLQRFIHHIDGLADFSTLKFTKYNQYESLILPLVKYLVGHRVHFMYDTKVTNAEFDFTGGRKTAKRMLFEHSDSKEYIGLTENDLVFITNGSCTENSSLGDNDNAPILNESEGGCWALWRSIAQQDKAFGNPDKFCTNIKKTNWESATITITDDRITPYIQKICQRDPHNGGVVTGGIVTIKDSNWLCSWTISRQPHFKLQNGEIIVWLYSLFTDVPGDYIKKPMKDCTGTEIVEEWLYHLGVPKDKIYEYARNATNCVPCMMPYITAFYMPRTEGDRPLVVPKGSTNFAFIGQFAETERDCVFTTEYAVRTAMEAVYTLLDVDRGVPEVFDSCYDIRCLLEATSKMMDGKKMTEMKVPFGFKFLEKRAIHKVKNTVIGELLRKYKLI